MNDVCVKILLLLGVPGLQRCVGFAEQIEHSFVIVIVWEICDCLDSEYFTALPKSLIHDSHFLGDIELASVLPGRSISKTSE
jgi:hypothetical protein